MIILYDIIIDHRIKDIKSILILWGLLDVATTRQASSIFSVMHIDRTISATAALWAIQCGLETYVSKVTV